MRNRIQLLLLVMASFVLVACGSVELNDAAKDYQFGDLSVKYCSAENTETRAILKTGLAVVAAKQGFQVGVDYCKALSGLSDGYSAQDIINTWCATEDLRELAQLDVLFGKELAAQSIELNGALCEVSDEPDT